MIAIQHSSIFFFDSQSKPSATVITNNYSLYITQGTRDSVSTWCAESEKTWGTRRRAECQSFRLHEMCSLTLIKFGENSHVMCPQILYTVAGVKIGNARTTPQKYHLAYWKCCCCANGVISSKLLSNGWHVASSIWLLYHVFQKRDPATSGNHWKSSFLHSV